MLYIASPYRHTDSTIQAIRFSKVYRYTEHLLKEGFVVYSPLVYTLPLERHAINPKHGWLNHNLRVLTRCSRMQVLCLDGWRDSEGVHEELMVAWEKGLDTEYVYEVGDTYEVTSIPQEGQE